MVRTIIEENSSGGNFVEMSIFSKLLQSRMIFINGPIDDELTNNTIAQLLYLDSVDSTSYIHVYINSPGGYVNQGFAIYDIAKKIKAPIRTVCIGEAASMGALLMLMGKQRCATKHSQIMVHQVSGGSIGTLTEMKISVDQARRLQDNINVIIQENTLIKNPEEFLLFDKWLSSEEALELGILTEII